MSAPPRPDIEGIKQLVATRRADERYDAITVQPSEAGQIEAAIAYIEELERVIRAAIYRLEAGSRGALDRLKSLGVPDA